MSEAPRQPPQSIARLIWQAIQVRLRFVTILLAAFLVMGGWPWLRRAVDGLWNLADSRRGSGQTVSDDTEFFCPMDPGVLSDWPAICPICKMDLVRRKRGEAALLPEGVLARMQFSPYRVQAAGIQTSIVSRRELFQTIRIEGRVVDSSQPSSFRDSDPLDAPVVECLVSTADHERLSIGLAVELEFDSRSQTIPGRIRRVMETGEDGSEARWIRVGFDISPGASAVGRFCTGRIAIPYRNSAANDTGAFEKLSQSSNSSLAIPDSALVDLGARQVVYVESMPGMFDAVEVVLGPRCGDFYPVETGLEEGLKVATTGVFLIDAEARLNPAVGAAYFGSARTRGPSSADGSLSVPLAATKSIRQKAAPLTASEREQAQLQKICPVTDADLDSMGGPVLIEVSGRKLFICCQGCESAVRGDPEKFFAKLPGKK